MQAQMSAEADQAITRLQHAYLAGLLSKDELLIRIAKVAVEYDLTGGQVLERQHEIADQ